MLPRWHDFCFPRCLPLSLEEYSTRFSSCALTLIPRYLKVVHDQQAPPQTSLAEVFPSPSLRGNRSENISITGRKDMGYPIPQGIGMVYGVGKKCMDPIPINKCRTKTGTRYPMGWDIRGTLEWVGNFMGFPMTDKKRFLMILIIILAPLPYMLGSTPCFHGGCSASICIPLLLYPPLGVSCPTLRSRRYPDYPYGVSRS